MTFLARAYPKYKVSQILKYFRIYIFLGNLRNLRNLTKNYDRKKHNQNYKKTVKTTAKKGVG